MSERTMTLIEHIATLIEARQNCLASGNDEWFAKHTDRLHDLEHYLPSGSGVDSGTKIDLDRSTIGKIVLNTSFHHMDECGGYDGWTDHDVIVWPTFQGIGIKVGGRNRNEIKDYLGDLFDSALSQKIIQDLEGYRLAA